MSLTYRGQALQDKFVVSVLKNKQNGYFLEIGSNHYQSINNSYVLEKELNWKGIMIEFNENYKADYDLYRPNSAHVIEDATKIDYNKLLKDNNAPLDIDYLQIDLDVYCRSTLSTLENLNDNNIFDNYRFAVITFEHDIYNGEHFNTRSASRDIFLNKNYVMVFPDVRNGENAFEDWYVHPDLVDMDYINKVKSNESLEYNEIMTRLDQNK